MTDAAQNHRSVRRVDVVVAHVAFMVGWVLGGITMLLPWYQRTEPWGLLSGMVIGGVTSTAYVLWRERQRGGDAST